MSIFGTTGICESLCQFLCFLPKIRSNGLKQEIKAAICLYSADKNIEIAENLLPQSEAAGKRRPSGCSGQETAKPLPQKRRGKRRAFCGVRTRKLCRKIWQKRAAGCVAAAWRPQRTPAFRRVAFGLLLRFCCFAVLPLVAPLPRAGRHFLCLTGLCISAALRYTYFNHNTQPPGAVRGCAGEGSRNKTEPGLPRREGSHHAVYH